jgi:hypothetical protein
MSAQYWIKKTAAVVMD